MGAFEINFIPNDPKEIGGKVLLSTLPRSRRKWN